MNLLTITVPVPGVLIPNRDEDQLLADVMSGKYTDAILAAIPEALSSGSVQVEILQSENSAQAQFQPPSYAAA